MPQSVEFAKVLAKVAEWLRGSDDAARAIPTIREAWMRSGDTGFEHMAHSPAPGSSYPALTTNLSPDWVMPQSYLTRRDLWRREQPQDIWAFHTHPSQYHGAEFPLFSMQDLAGGSDMAEITRPEGSYRFAVGTPAEGSFLGAIVRGQGGGFPYDQRAQLNLEKLKRMGYLSGERLGDEGMQRWSQRLAQDYGDPRLLGNLQASAPLFKAQGDLTEPLSAQFADPSWFDTIRDYIRESHMCHGGYV